MSMKTVYEVPYSSLSEEEITTIVGKIVPMLHEQWKKLYGFEVRFSSAKVDNQFVVTSDVLLSVSGVFALQMFIEGALAMWRSAERHGEMTK